MEQKNLFLFVSACLWLLTGFSFQVHWGPLVMEFLNFSDPRNISSGAICKKTVSNWKPSAGTIMQTASRIQLTFSQPLNQLEIIDSPSAMIKMERLNEEVLFFSLLAFFFYKRTIELVTGLECCVSSALPNRAQLLEGNKTVHLWPPSNHSTGVMVFGFSQVVCQQIHLLDSL